MTTGVVETIDILNQAISAHRGRVALACSFGGPSGMVLLDLVMRIDRSVPVYYLDTGLLFDETYALVEAVSKRYGVRPIAVLPALTLEEQRSLYGDELWSRDPDRCCRLRKVEPQRQFLENYDAWITGARRDQTRERADLEVLSKDELTGCVKISPLAHWTEPDVWAYVREHDVPVNALHRLDYPSIGCTPCTRAVRPGEDARAGRWSGSEKTECGLHARVGS
jgi:phosphoadenosine phosphosulfate reductase